MKLKTLILFLVFVNCTLSISAQKNNTKIKLTGTVTDSSGKPVPNAMVLIDGENTNSSTNDRGEYKIKINRDAQTIGIFAFGNGIVEEPVDGRAVINFRYSNSSSMKETESEIQPGEEGINTGYNYVKKKNLTTQITKIDGTDKKYSSYSTIYDMIQREVAGVKVKGHSIVIQDSKNLWITIPPLFVVDGAYVDTIENISPSSVQSIEVLKGAAASMYGSRGYGGVIIIRTKIN